MENPLVKARLGLQTVDDCEFDMPCPACSNRRAPHGDFYNPDSTIIRPDGLHVHCCRETGKGGASGLTAARHEHVKFTVIDIIKKYGSRTNITTDINKEPVLKDLFPPKVSSGGNVPIRGDILLDIGGVKKVLDVVISHPIDPPQSSSSLRSWLRLLQMIESAESPSP